MNWRLAGSLERLREQVNAAYPNRNKVSDGTIGDPSHQAEGSGSDHNPNKHGVVCAFDITHDPKNGLDIVRLADALAASRDSRIKYLIRNRQIMVPSDYGWKWVAYTGSNPHTSHLHVSVYGDYDNKKDWNIGGDMIEENEASFLVLHKLVRQAKDEELTLPAFRSEFVGKSWREQVKAINDSGQAANRVRLAKLGEQAERDRWQNQIEDRNEDNRKKDVLIGELKEQLKNGYEPVKEQLYRAKK